MDGKSIRASVLLLKSTTVPKKRVTRQRSIRRDAQSPHARLACFISLFFFKIHKKIENNLKNNFFFQIPINIAIFRPFFFTSKSSNISQCFSSNVNFYLRQVCFCLWSQFPILQPIYIYISLFLCLQLGSNKIHQLFNQEATRFINYVVFNFLVICNIILGILNVF